MITAGKPPITRFFSRGEGGVWVSGDATQHWHGRRAPRSLLGRQRAAAYSSPGLGARGQKKKTY